MEQKPLMQVNISEEFFWNVSSMIFATVLFFVVLLLIGKAVDLTIEHFEQKEVNENGRRNNNETSKTSYADGITANNGY